MISRRCARSRERRKASVPKGWIPTKRHRLTSCTLRAARAPPGAGRGRGRCEGCGLRAAGGGAGCLPTRCSLRTHSSRLQEAAEQPPNSTQHYTAKQRSPALRSAARSAPLQVVQRQLVVEQLGKLEELGGGDHAARAHALRQAGSISRGKAVGRQRGGLFANKLGRAWSVKAWLLAAFRASKHGRWGRLTACYRLVLRDRDRAYLCALHQGQAPARL